MPVLLRPYWLARHVGFVLAIIALLLLGWWQLDRAQVRSWNPQNLLYSAEWWVFAGFVVYVWVRMARDAAAGGRPSPVGVGRPPSVPPVGAIPARRRPPAPVAVVEEEDPVMAEYNAYLRSRNSRPGKRARSFYE